MKRFAAICLPFLILAPQGCGPSPVDLGTDLVEITLSDQGSVVRTDDSSELSGTHVLPLGEASQVRIVGLQEGQFIDILGLKVGSGTIQIVEGTPAFESAGRFYTDSLCTNANGDELTLPVNVLIGTDARSGKTIRTGRLVLPEQAARCVSQMNGDELRVLSENGRITGLEFDGEATLMNGALIVQPDGSETLEVVNVTDHEAPPGFRFALNADRPIYGTSSFVIGYVEWKSSDNDDGETGKAQR